MACTLKSAVNTISPKRSRTRETKLSCMDADVCSVSRGLIQATFAELDCLRTDGRNILTPQMNY